MRWGNVLDKNEQSFNNSCVDPQELLLAQILSVRLLLIQAGRNKIDNNDWGEIFNWLGMKLPVSGSSPQSENYHEALKNWLKTSSESISTEKNIDCLIVYLVDYVSKMLQLDKVEKNLLMLAWLRLRHETMAPIMDNIDAPSSLRALSLLLGHSSASIHNCLSDKSRLVRLEIIKGIGFRFDTLEDILEPCSLLEALFPIAYQKIEYQHQHLVSQAISSCLVTLCPLLPEAKFSLSSFNQIPMLQLLLDYLRQALKTRKRGANVLIYGQPGVGKTELIKSLATQLGVPLYGVPVTEANLYPIPPNQRISRYCAVQQLLGWQPALVMFDEIEDVMNDQKNLPKGWTNQLLENNPFPSIWVSNSVHWLDPAYQRRFDLIIEIKASSSSTVQQHYQKLLDKVPVTPLARKYLAAQPWMNPALVDQLNRLAPLLNTRTPIRNERHIAHLLSNRLQAQGISSPVLLGQNYVSEIVPKMPNYRMEWINTTPSLEHILKRLQQRGCGRLCLYGLPGSGKTALAKHLSDSLGYELITAHASTLLDKYVGDTEKKIAELFQRSHSKNTVLLIDEIDSLLLSRDSASYSWEISHTNELLVQLENFKGILLVTTNHLDSLDRAVMRRFDLKIAFHPLAPNQLRGLLKKVLPTRDHPRLEGIPEHHLAQRRLTPGNIRTALAQLDLRGLPVRLNTLMEALVQEEREQHGNKQPMRFV